MPEEPIAEDAYDAPADEYAAEVETNAYNAHLEFPATTSLLRRRGRADPRRRLWHRRLHRVAARPGRRGGQVVGVDVSREMLAHAVEDLGDRAEFQRANLEASLAFEDDAFDGVVSALALGYVRDWERTFSEFARVLEPGGFVVFSVLHPLDTLDGEANYFAVEVDTKEWSVDVPYYRRPLSAMIDPLLDAGLRLDELVEPRPTEAFREERPERHEKESRRPVFLCVRAVLE